MFACRLFATRTTLAVSLGPKAGFVHAFKRGFIQPNGSRYIYKQEKYSTDTENKTKQPELVIT